MLKVFRNSWKNPGIRSFMKLSSFMIIIVFLSFRCVAVDMRGYGESDKPKGVVNYTTDKLAEDLKELIEALGMKLSTYTRSVIPQKL